MKPHTPFSVQFIRLSAVMLVSTWLVSGCSESSEPGASDTPPPIDSTAGDPETETETETNPTNNASNDNLDAMDDEPGDNTSGDETAPDGTDENVNSDPAVEDPLIQNRILVTFEITVPFIISNELRVELDWGDISLTAAWVGGQFWTASGEFPTQTEHPLVISFYDNNGAIELARYREVYKTASNVSEAVEIPAEQFDATQFDTDGDGTSNLDELNAGTDPLVDEGAQLEIEDFYALSDPSGVYSRISVSETFESRLSANRPYVASIDSDPDSLGAPVSGNIDIDISGNGTLDVNPDEAPRRPLIQTTGVRTVSESSVSWEGIRREWGSEYFHMETVTNTVTVVDDQIRTFAEELTGTNNGAYEYTWETSANLTGKLIEGTTLCEPVAGTFSAREQIADPTISVVVTTVSKEFDDRYWKVTVVDDDANNVNDSESQTREYFVRKLRIQQRPDTPDTAFFICDFVDL